MSETTMAGKPEKSFVVCVRNTDYPASLELRKIYEALSDPGAEEVDQLRIIDESGESYSYPRDYFLPIELPQDLRVAILRAS